MTKYKLLDTFFDYFTPPEIQVVRAKIPRLGTVEYQPINTYCEECLRDAVNNDEDSLPVKTIKTITLIRLHSFLAIGLFYPFVWRWIAYVVKPTEDELRDTLAALRLLMEDRARRVREARDLFKHF